MQLFELMTTIETKNVSNIQYEGINLMELNQFILENNISYSTLDEYDSNLNLMKDDTINQLSDEEDVENAKDEYDYIINKYGHIVNNEIYVQNFDIEDGKVKISLS